jgi:plastocyanin
VEPELFYWIGGATAVAALVVSAIGIRSEKFPPSRGAMAGVIAVFVFLVLGSTTYAVVNARDEQERHLAELEEEQEAAGAEELAAEETGEEGPITGDEGAAAQAGEEEVAGGEDDAGPPDVADGGGQAPDDDAADDNAIAMSEYAFGPEAVTVKAGESITADNEGAVTHNLTLFDGNDEITGTEDVAAGESATLEIDVDPGTYEMICTIPGHEDLGMAGEFTVE